MTAYFDSSALLKAFLHEQGCGLVRSTLSSDPVVWTCAVAYVEIRAGFVRAVRENRIASSAHAALTASFEQDWASYAIVPIDPALLHRAADLADRHSHHALRAFDAVHLAAALQVAVGSPPGVTFVCWDRRLW